MSAESGVPTFRGSAGTWGKYDPEVIATPQAFARDPGLVWEFYNFRRNAAAAARPNAAHYAVAAFQRRAAEDGVGVSLITQNVDGLHQVGPLSLPCARARAWALAPAADPA